MNQIVFKGAIVAAVLAVAGCMETGTEAKPTVMDPLKGKTIQSETATFIIGADGTMGGTMRNQDIVGVYKADDKVSCSTYTAPDVLTGREWCSVPVVAGDTVVFHRTDGTKSPEFKILN